MAFEWRLGASEHIPDILEYADVGISCGISTHYLIRQWGVSPA